MLIIIYFIQIYYVAQFLYTQQVLPVMVRKLLETRRQQTLNFGKNVLTLMAMHCTLHCMVRCTAKHGICTVLEI